MYVLDVTLEDVRAQALALPRSYEALVRGRVKFRVSRLVYLAASRDESLLGFAFPKDEREGLVESEPDKFMLPKPIDLRYHWAVVRLAAIDHDEMSEIVFQAWRMVVPKFLAAEVGAQRSATTTTRWCRIWPIHRFETVPQDKSDVLRQPQEVNHAALGLPLP